MIGDFMALVGLAKELRGALRRLPDGVGFSIVRYKDPSHDHLRVVNLTPLAIHGFKFAVQKGEHGQALNVSAIWHPSPADVFGEPVNYIIEIPEQGIYLRPAALYYVPLRTLPGETPLDTDDIRVGFSYVTPDGDRQQGNLQHVARIKAQGSRLEPVART